MKNLLQFLRGKFKHVVIDSPPAISFTDAAILSTLVDGVVLVAMAGKSSIHLMRRFKHRLANIGARVYGVVLNGMKADSANTVITATDTHIIIIRSAKTIIRLRKWKIGKKFFRFIKRKNSRKSKI